MSSPKVTRWGILATGAIAESFSKDLLVDPNTRGVSSVKHEIVAAASSSSESRAQEFLKTVGASASAKAYGSYAELVKDANIDIIYVATPHSHHYQNVMLCLEANKNVLCEKAFTVNADQAKKLVQIAREKNLFLMEAVWTRYFPLSIYAREQVTSGRIGTVHRTIADLSIAGDPEKQFADGKHRLVNMNLAGGALLDLGIYALTWVFQTLYDTQPKDARKPPTIVSSVKKYEPTGADEATTVLLTFPRSLERGGDAHGIALTSLRVASNSSSPAIRVIGDQGELQVFHPAFRPTRTKLALHDGTVEEKEWKQPGPGKGSGWFNGFKGDMNAEGEGHGMFWEADEAATALAEGRKEGRFESLDDSILIMEVMDQVRKQHGFSYPQEIESTDYPIDLPKP